MTSPEARQWDVCGYANPVLFTISAGSTTLCNEGALGSFKVSIAYMRPDLLEIDWIRNLLSVWNKLKGNLIFEELIQTHGFQSMLQLSDTSGK